MATKQKLTHSSLAHVVSKEKRRGLLIAVEGVDGSGKTTQLELMNNWLKSNGFATVLTSWNSYPTVRPLIKRIKQKEIVVRPEVFSLMHLADFAERYERIIQPALRAGVTVFCDRYIYTALARDTARGLDQQWVRHMYSFAPIPDLTFYFSVPPAVSFQRKASLPNFYEAGMDLGVHKNIRKSFEHFQGRVIQEYERLAISDNLIRIDGTNDIFVTFPTVRAIVEQAIAKKYHIHV